MLDVKCNYSQSYFNLSCPAFMEDEEKETQSHLLEFEALSPESVVSSGDIEYDQLFCENVETQTVVVKISKKNFQKRKTLLQEGSK